MSARRPLLALSATLLPLSAPAQEAPDLTILDPVVLSAGLTPMAANAYGRAFTVITAEEIQARGLATVQDALRGVPGLSVSSAGGNMTQVRIRGGEARHTLILIDGIEAKGGADEYILSGLETANVERIEVLRGPQSVYYGSNAATGVINIITRQGGPGLQYGGSAEVGNGWAAAGHVSQRGERGGIALNLSARDDHGFDQSGEGGEKDGTKRRTVGLSGDFRATPDLTFGASLRRSREDYDFDSSNWMATSPEDYVIDDPLPTSRRDETQAAVWGEYAALDGRLTHRLEYQDTLFKQGFNGGPADRGETEAVKYRGSLGLDGRPAAEARQLLNLMAEYWKDSSTTAPGQERERNSLALEYRGFFDNGLDVQAGLRHDANKVFEDFTSWNLGLSYRVAETPFRLHGSAGTGLVNPSFFELFADADYGSQRYIGNPDLRPETNRGYDLGVEAEVLGGRGTIDLTYFNERLKDEIESYFVGIEDGVAVYSYRNQAGESPRQGIELSARLQATEALLLGLSYTYLDAKNPDGSVEIRRPRHEVGLSATLAVLDGRGTVSADLRHVAGNYDTQFWAFYETKELPSYTVVNLAAGYDVTENLRATARIVNLFDEDYSDVWGYVSQGRTAWVGLQATW